MADFSGAVFVGMDEELVGDGSNTSAPLGTMFLDSFAEATLRAAAYYIHEGYDLLAWTPPVGDTDVTVNTGSRPFCSVQWFTTLPPALVKVTPDMIGIELHGLYRVADEGGGSDVYKILMACDPLGSRTFDLAHTVASTPDWQPFHKTLTFTTRPVRNMWVRLEVYGHGIDTADVGSTASSGNAIPVVRSMLNATNTGSIYAEGSGASPNNTTQDVRCTKVTDGTGGFRLVDHIHFYDPSAEDFMVINPPLEYDPALSAVQRQMTYLQLAGVSIRPVYETEI